MTNPEDNGIKLELLTMEHASRVEQFERANREFFASRISDRGDDYFAHFTERLAPLVAENHAGASLFFVLVATSGQVVGRVNIMDINQPDRTELGFRLAADMQGKGVATRGVKAALEWARERGVRSIMARAAVDNLGSQRVLERCGFTATGAAETPAGSDRTFRGYRIVLKS
ncbi:MAG: GNAT family N-acetyltransferase [Microlunatus sp.]|nr:GNAT family N-acetyltransferase [Microlunatus sp.]